MAKQGFKNQWIAISQQGKFRDSAGVERNLNADFLEQVLANTKPNDAPAVIGHPKDNSPAFGWATALRVNDGVLEAQFADTDDEFEQMVEKGTFRKRSASFYLNPPSLRHVGFLGAQPPAVKGLRDIQFNDGDSVTVEISFNEEDSADSEFIAEMIPHHQSAIAMVKKFLSRFKHPELRTLGESIVTAQTKEIDRMRDWQKKWGGSASEKTPMKMDMSEEQTMKEEEVNQVTDSLMDKLKNLFKTETAPSITAAAATASFSEADAQKLIDAAVAKAKAEAKTEAVAEFSETIKGLQEAVNASSVSGKRAEIVSFVEAIPAQNGKHFLKNIHVVEFLEACANADAANKNVEVIAFSEGSGDNKVEHKFTMLDYAKTLISALPPMIEFGEKFGKITATANADEAIKNPANMSAMRDEMGIKEGGAK